MATPPHNISRQFSITNGRFILIYDEVYVLPAHKMLMVLRYRYLFIDIIAIIIIIIYDILLLTLIFDTPVFLFSLAFVVETTLTLVVLTPGSERFHPSVF